MSTDTQNNAPMKVEQVNWPAVEARISEFVGEYEMVGEDEQGRDGRYTPNESERALILDAMHGALADAELMALLRPAAPVADQSDLTQQTLDDVMAGIPARDAEIEALRKEIDTLRAQHDADTVDAERYRAWRDALITGKTAEDDFIRLVADSLPTSVGVSRRPTAAEWDAAIDAARKENSNA